MTQWSLANSRYCDFFNQREPKISYILELDCNVAKQGVGLFLKWANWFVYEGIYCCEGASEGIYCPLFPITWFLARLPGQHLSETLVYF